MKKAQIQGQVFIYILMIVIVSLILLYGYRAIKDFGTKSEQISLIESKGMIKNAIDKNTAYRRIRKVDVDLPTSFTHICFVSSEVIGEITRLGNPDDSDPSPIYTTGYEIIQDSVDTGYNKNMFYYPDGTEAMDVGNIVIQGGFDCYRKVGGIVRLRMEGLGDSVKISEWVSQ